MKISKNVGTVDRLFRAIIGCSLLTVVFFSPLFENDLISRAIIGMFGVGMILSSIFGYCPTYALIGLSTCKPFNAK